MSLESLLSRLSPMLERAAVPYMLTGSVASSAYGTPRSTLDLDIVVAPTEDQMRALMRQFPQADYYADEQQAMQALHRRSQFNVIDLATGWKVDFIIAEDSEYGRGAIGRRVLTDVAGTRVFVASPEDVLIAKVRWANLGGSERQLRDAAGVVGAQGSNLDMSYITHWLRELGLEEQWKALRKML